MVAGQTALLDKEETAELSVKQKVVNLIPGAILCPLFLKQHLHREVIIGIIGSKGEGKSASSASIALIDGAMRGKTFYSNMNISCDIAVDPYTARSMTHGMLTDGGVAHYQSLPLDKEALLKLDDKYRGAYIVIEEINVQYSNTRRTQTNTNIDFNMVVQELRHLESTLIYNVVDEMFIDTQLRTMTDIFIKCEDTAYSLDNMAKRKEPGMDIKWTVYPMSPWVCGRERSYYATQKPLDPMFFHFGMFRGIYDDKEFQHKGVYSMNAKMKAAMEDKELPLEMSIDSDPEVELHKLRYGWLRDKVVSLRNQSGIEFIIDTELWGILGIAQMGETPHSMGKILPSYGIHKHHQGKFGRWFYQIDPLFKLD